MLVDTIRRYGDDRLSTRVRIVWWGTDPDGFIDHYEYTFDDINASPVWISTNVNDTTFLLPTPVGEDTADFRFYVRAIDNTGLSDPTPATLVYPVRNSPPSVSFVSSGINTERTFPVLRFSWEGSDPDGFENLSGYEFVINDSTSTPVTLPVTAVAITLKADDPTVDFPDASIYLNNNTTTESFKLSGLRLDDTNRVYIRAVDQSGARSAYMSSNLIHVKKVRSTVLMVNAYSSPGQAATAKTFYGSGLTTQGITLFDTMNLFESGLEEERSPDNLTQSRVFELFETIIWFGNNAETSLSLAQKTTTEFLDNGGKLFMATYVSSSFDEQSQFLDFTPVDELLVPEDTILILDKDSILNPVNAGWPILMNTTIIGVVRPMLLKTGAEPLYHADLIARDPGSMLWPWGGVSVVMAKGKDLSGNTNFIFSTLELQSLDGNANIDELFEKVLIDEFGL